MGNPYGRQIKESNNDTTVLVKVKENLELIVNKNRNNLKELGMPDLEELVQTIPNLKIEKLITNLPEAVVKDTKLDSNNHDSLEKYYRISLPQDSDRKKILSLIKKDPGIEFAYLEAGPVEPPVINPNNNPRYANQGYLKAAPEGIDAIYSWTFLGGDGEGIQFADVERGWTLNHEDLLQRNVILISGVNKDYFGHGTAVLGEILSYNNKIGCIGISPNLLLAGVASQWETNVSYNTANAILAAANFLRSGDILLIEAQTNFEGFNGVPVETEPPVFDAIKYAINKGIVVIEAAGNGSVDLDTFTDLSGKKVLNRLDPNFKDSGAILVASASSAIPHQKHWVSSFGSRVDCYSWGENIDTTGDGWAGNSTNVYTQSPMFGGTSGASAIIAGAAINIQGIAINYSNKVLTPSEMRVVLTNSGGTPSANPTSDKIGIMPNLKQIIDFSLVKNFKINPTKIPLSADI